MRKYLYCSLLENVIKYISNHPYHFSKQNLVIAPDWFKLDIIDLNPQKHILFIYATNSFGKMYHMGQNVVLFSNPHTLMVPEKAKVNTFIKENDDGIYILLSADKTILYVVLTTLAQGRFDDNAFAIKKGETKVRQ